MDLQEWRTTESLLAESKKSGIADPHLMRLDRHKFLTKVRLSFTTRNAIATADLIDLGFAEGNRGIVMHDIPNPDISQPNILL